MKSLRTFLLAVIAGLALVLVIGLAVFHFPNWQGLPFSGTKAAPVRLAKVLYLSPASGGSDLWASAADGSERNAITHTGGKVIDFSPSPDGEQIVMIAGNTQGGSDILLTARDGAGQRVLVACGTDECAGAAWSPDGHKLAFTRLSSVPNPGETPGIPRPWVYDLAGGEAQPLDNDPLVGAEIISWSPDGKRMALYDPQAKGIRVRDLQSGKEMVLRTNFPTAGSWSPDGQHLVFNLEENSGGFAFTKVYVMDFSTGKPSLLLGQEESDASDYGLPAWSPDGQWLVFGQRTLPGNPSKQLRLIHPDGKGTRKVTDDPAATHAAYRWSPDSHALVYQQFALGSSENNPEVVVWQVDSGQTVVIARDATLPQWLP